MLQARSRIDPMVVENGHMRDSRIETQFVITRLVHAQYVGNLIVGHLGHRQGMIGRFDDDVMHAEPLDCPTRAMDDPGGRDLAGQRCELVGDNPHLPRALVIG